MVTNLWKVGLLALVALPAIQAYNAKEQKQSRTIRSMKPSALQVDAQGDVSLADISKPRTIRSEKPSALEVSAHGDVSLAEAADVTADASITFEKQFEAESSVSTKMAQQFPSDIMTCPSGAVSATRCMTEAQYDQIMNRVNEVMSSLPSTCNADTCPQADWAGCVLRMAGHDFMDFQWGAGGGSDGCIDFNDPDNAGLQPCLTTGRFVHQGDFMNATILSIYQEVCSTVSLADFLVLAAEGVMAYTRLAAGYTDASFKSRFTYGRKTATECSFAHGRLPNPDNGCSATQTVFVDHLDLTWEESAALMGVHTLGRAHKQNSGFHGWWSDPLNSRKFNNNYYVSLLAKAWGAVIVPDTGKAQYDRVDWGDKQSTPGNEMMLNTDMCLAFADVPAADAVSRTDCSCTWAMPMMDVVAAMPHQEWCGNSSLFPSSTGASDEPGIEDEPVSEEAATVACCDQSPTGGSQTCDDIFTPTGRAIQHVRRFAANDTAWFQVFNRAWRKATTIGFAHQPGVLLPLADTCSAEDSSRTVPDVVFPSTTGTTTTTTTPPPHRASEETIARWYFAASMESCSRTCQRNGKQCNHDSWSTHGHELDSYAKMSELLNRISTLERSNNPGAEKEFVRTFDGRRHQDESGQDFTQMGGGTTATATRMYTGRSLTPAGIGHPWNQGFRCEEDVNSSDSFMTPAAHYIGRLAPDGGPGYQCRYNIINRSYEQDQCERHYHGASWRRLCVCDEPDPQPTTDVDTSACLRLGSPDSECCSRPSEAACLPGFKYTLGTLCMWSHDHDYFTTECRPQTTTTTTLPSYAEGYFLSPLGDPNCSAVCEENELTCTSQGFADAYDEISDYATVSAIVRAVGPRDWLGLNEETVYPQCLHNSGRYGHRIWPGTWGRTMHWFNCHYYYNRDRLVPDDYCDPANAPRGGRWRRLCKCQTTTTTTMIPSGYELVGRDARCTDAAHTSWREIEFGPGPDGRWSRSRQPSIAACAARCDSTHGCHGFAYWDTGSNIHHCRTYRACTHLASHNAHEYRGSMAVRRVSTSSAGLLGEGNSDHDDEGLLDDGTEDSEHDESFEEGKSEKDEGSITSVKDLVSGHTSADDDEDDEDEEVDEPECSGSRKLVSEQAGATGKKRWCGHLKNTDQATCEGSYTYKKCSKTAGQDTVYYKCKWSDDGQPGKPGKKCYAAGQFTCSDGVGGRADPCAE